MRRTVHWCAAMALLMLSVLAARGQSVVLLPPTPVEPAPTEPVLTPDDLETDAKSEPAAKSVRVPELLGDQAPIGSLMTLPHGRIQGTGVLYVPSVRYFKISDNDSPEPRTRSYLSFNYFHDLYSQINQQAGGGIQHTRIHREIFGVEWASADGRESFGLRLPINTYNAAHTVDGLDGTSTDIGDLSVIFKYLLWREPGTSRLLSAGLAITAPTGPGSFGGSGSLRVFHNTILQPFAGWIWTWGAVYVQGFTAVDAPTDLNDVVFLDNSVAIGYFLYQAPNDRGITAVVPTVEVHAHNPLNHHGVTALKDPAGNPDMVQLTGGLQIEYSSPWSFGVGFSTPVTGPRMFDFEILAQYRCRY